MLALCRRDPIPAGHRVEDYAQDYIRALEQLALGPVVLECSSAGGPIGQWLAAERPDLIRGLVLSSTLHTVPSQTRAVFERWIALARSARLATWSGI